MINTRSIPDSTEAPTSKRIQHANECEDKCEDKNLICFLHLTASQITSPPPFHSPLSPIHIPPRAA